MKLSLGHTVPVEYDSVGLEARRLVELDQQLLDHGGKVLDDLLPVLLHPHSSCIPTRMSVHAANDLCPKQNKNSSEKYRCDSKKEIKMKIMHGMMQEGRGGH